MTLGFGLGTFKFLIAHWTVYAVADTSDLILFEILFSVTAGALFSMSLFYFSSGFLMKKAKMKKLKAKLEAAQSGKEIKAKKVFTRTNKTIVWIKRYVGIYGVTFLAPLFLSIPLGSIVCSKFYGNRRRTFPLMVIFISSYSTLMFIWMWALS